MLLDSTLLFWHTGNVFNLTSGEFVSLVGATGNSASSAINLGNPRDLGIGEGAERPNVIIAIGPGGITSSSATLTVNFQFQGSTNGTSWTTYIETGAMTTASLQAGSVFSFTVPRRPVGAPLPLYYQLNAAVGSNAGTAGISTGSVLAGIVLAPSATDTPGQYPAGFSVA